MSVQIVEYRLLCRDGTVHYATVDFAAVITLLWPSDGWTRNGIGCGPHWLKSWAVGVSEPSEPGNRRSKRDTGRTTVQTEARTECDNGPGSLTSQPSKRKEADEHIIVTA